MNQVRVNLGSGAVRLLGRRCWPAPQVAAIQLPAGAASPPREEGGRRWAE